MKSLHTLIVEDLSSQSLSSTGEKFQRLNEVAKSTFVGHSRFYLSSIAATSRDHAAIVKQPNKITSTLRDFRSYMKSPLRKRLPNPRTGGPTQDGDLA